MPSTTEPFVILDSVDSTNNYAMGMVRAGLAGHANAWLSNEQTHGKGRRGKVWKAEKGSNIILSIAVVPQVLTISQQFFLSVAASLAGYDLFKKYAGEDTKIKWPNDIFWNDRKAGGILIENIINREEWKAAVIGIGININQTKFDADGNFLPVSLKQITGKNFNVIELAKELYNEVIKRYQQLEANEFDKMLREYNQKLYKLNEKVKLKRDNIVFETVIKGVSGEGKLMTADVMEREFDFDEVEWVIVNDN